VRQTAESRWFSGWSAGQVLQRCLPDGGASRTAPDGAGYPQLTRRRFVVGRVARVGELLDQAFRVTAGHRQPQVGECPPRVRQPGGVHLVHDPAEANSHNRALYAS
jgi:hypothetical protein